MFTIDLDLSPFDFPRYKSPLDPPHCPPDNKEGWSGEVLVTYSPNFLTTDNNSSSEAWSFEGPIKIITSKKEFCSLIYHRDLEEFGSGLKKEIGDQGSHHPHNLGPLEIP